ncbi:MAG: hypothetical protein RL885_31855 [Planctomycetota bacterium]
MTNVPMRGLCALFLASIFALPQVASAQYQLAPGDIIIADHGVEFGHKTVVLRKADGTVLEPARDFVFDGGGFALSGVTDVAVDARGRILLLGYDPTGQSPLVYRVEPNGVVLPLVGARPNDAFGMATDKFGNLLIANGFVGLLRVTPDGSVQTVYSGHSSGVTIAANGDYLVSNAPQREILRVTPQGDVSSLLQGAVLINPLGLTRDNADNVYIANAGRRDIVKVATDGSFRIVSRDPALTFPTDVAIGAGGNLIVPDGGTSGSGLDAVFRIAPNGTAVPLLFDGQDGAIDGFPVDDPFGVYVVPELFITYSGQAVRGGRILVTIQGEPGAPFLLGLSSGAQPTPLSAIFPRDDRFLDVDLSQLRGFVTGTIASNGARTLTLDIPVGTPIGRRFVQAVTLDPSTNRIDDISNPISAEIF